MEIKDTESPLKILLKRDSESGSSYSLYKSEALFSNFQVSDILYVGWLIFIAIYGSIYFT